MTDLALSITTPQEPGWLQLPVNLPKRKLFGSKRGLEKPLTDWADAQARDALGPDAAPEVVSAYTELLTSLARSSRERGDRMAFVWFPEPGGLPAAQISVSTFGSPHGSLTLDFLEEKFAWKDGQTGPLEAERTELPSGPAVRVRREQVSGDGEDDVAVSVTYAVLPAAMKEALVFTMFWDRSDDAPGLIETADGAAYSLRVTD